MSYVIEDNVPLPTSRRGGYRHSGPQSVWTQTIAQLKPGQSVLTPLHNEFKAAEQLVARSKPKVFAIRKIPSVGWRVWRLE